MSANLERLEKHNPDGALLKYLKEVEARLVAIETTITEILEYLDSKEKKGEKAKKK